MCDLNEVKGMMLNMESVRRGILSKLKTIRMREENLAMLDRYSSMSNSAFRELSLKDPQTIADCCLEEGLVPNTSKKVI